MHSTDDTLVRATGLHQAGELAQAEELCHLILSGDPQNVDALRVLAVVTGQTGRFDEAIELLLRALELAPDDAALHCNLGNARRGRGQPNEAVQCYRDAIAIQPNFADAHICLGLVLAGLGQLHAAIESFRRSLEIQPASLVAVNNLGHTFRDAFQIENAIECYREAARLAPECVEMQSDLLFALNFSPGEDNRSVLAEHLRFGQRYREVEHCPVPGDLDRNPRRRLRIGYVSPDLRAHAVARFIRPILANHDPAQVEVVCYAEVQKPDEETARLNRLSPGWRWTFGQSAAQVAGWVQEDRIDILVDLAGHTAGNRLDVFARKPAPIQVSWLGYPTTTGLDSIDYRVSDAILDPPDSPLHGSEKVFHLAGCQCAFAPPDHAPAISPLPAKRTGHLTFGSPHQLRKLNFQLFDRWCQVLNSVPGSHLLLFRHAPIASVRDLVARHFAQRGIGDDRFAWRQPTSANGYLNFYEEVDIVLDCAPFTSHTMTCESLWMGAPIITMTGSQTPSRLSASILHDVEIPEWVAHTPEEYVAIARRWAADLDGLADLRATLRSRMQRTVCDGRRFVRRLEEGYREMWRRWLSDHVVG